MSDPQRILLNNSGELGQRFPDAAVRKALWGALSVEIRKYLMAIDDTETFEQEFITELLHAGLIKPLSWKETSRYGKNKAKKVVR